MLFKLCTTTQILFILLVLQTSIADPKALNNSVYNLQTRLFDRYNVYIRSVHDQNTITNVTVDLTLMQVISMDDQRETITISGFLNFKWTDELMTWDPEKEGNITMLQVPVAHLWTPDIFLSSAADQGSWNQWDVSYVLVNLFYNGTCYVTPPALITTNCQLNVENFPFDEKFCKLIFESWMYTSDHIVLNAGPKVLLNMYTQNNAWNLEDTLQEVNEEIVDDSDGTYSVLTITLHLRRRTLFFSFNFILPSIIIFVCSIFGFILPPDSGEKIGLQITNLLGVIFFLQHVSTIVPPSSLGVARISLYFFLTSVLCMLSLIANAIVLDLYQRDIRIEGDMPKWLEKLVCVHLARILRMKKIHLNIDKVKIARSESDLSLKILVEMSDSKTTKINDSELIKRVTKIQNILSKIWDVINERANDEIKEVKWKYAAIVMDRLFLYIFIVNFLAMFIPIILTIKNFYLLN